MDKTVKVTTELGEVTVHKLALGDYAKLLKTFKKLPAEIGKFIQSNDDSKLKDLDVLLVELPSIVADSLPELAEVVSIATDKDKDFILKLDLADVVDLIGAILELNNYARVAESIKKFTARKTAPATTTEGQTTA